MAIFVWRLLAYNTIATGDEVRFYFIVLRPASRCRRSMTAGLPAKQTPPSAPCRLRTVIKSTWKILNTIINKKTNTSKLPSHFECNEINIVSKQSIADGFNNFFVDVGSNLDKKITVVDNAASIYDFMGQQCPNSMFINPVSEDEVVNIIKSCKPKHSKDCDDINMYVLSKVTDQIVKPLVHIFNLSFSSGIFPSEMKTAKVIPVFKSGNRSDFSNYRPISLLSQFSKILEKLFNLRLEQFLISNEILSNCQYGFRSCMSTVHAALELIESISTAVDNKKHCAGVFIDLKKAFDTVNHDLLVKKLFFYGIRGTANAWLNNYLTNRNQYVIADDHSSGMRLITCGVPQGSVLGPVLFLLYINDICNVSNLLKFVLFADDTNIFCSSTSLHDLQDTINRELDKLFVWFSVNRLSLNLGKTNYMLFRSRPPDNELALKINNVVLPRVAATKFLGIIIIIIYTTYIAPYIWPVWPCIGAEEGPSKYWIERQWYTVEKSLLSIG